ncbi:MAG: tRNA 2-thiocytidine(32) synthetase TtcA [Alphaproteobacteria bacterium]|nr:tRNA 2-thiocytidine(32) synthetase TtcA [Alphaproteobacteria bacterium]MCB9794317.1 tRNA 2-thiocytidine(32) synthetase TtcA [Alphaproteobacteria bacterium]
MPDADTTRLRKRLLRYIGRVNEDFGLIEAGDRIMVGISGGKDSYALMWLLAELQRRAPLEFSIVGVNLDQGHPGFPAHVIEGWFQEHGFEYKMLQRDTYSVVLEKIPEGRTYCSLCSRLRRGILYTAAEELGCNKIALGHHRDDLIETVMLNLLYSGQLKTMPPKLYADDGRNVVIRPLAYAPEEEIAEYARRMAFPVVPCDLCGSQENLQRQQVKALLAQLQAANPKVKGNMLAALGNVRVSHLLDKELLALRGLPVKAEPGEDPLSAY